MRDYGTAEWEGGDENCKHLTPDNDLKNAGEKQQTNVGSVRYEKNVCRNCGAKRIDKQLGLEQNPQDFITNLCDIFQEVMRVLKPTGTCFVNLGDTYAGSGSGTTKNADTSKYIENSKQVYVLPNGTAKASKFRGTGLNKSLLMIPERFAIEMIDEGWILREDLTDEEKQYVISELIKRKIL